ncbi:MAG TPA: hypothetical protein VFA81_03900 [Burkholderiales bacterium]|nr:hypothetical protein [Burkholderiales bacterium]
MKMLKESLLGAGLALALTSASAATVSQNLFSGFQQLSDNSAEALIKSPNNTGGSNIVEAGDRIRGVFDIQTAEQNGVTHFIGVNGNNELTGIFDIVVVSKTTIVPPSGSNPGTFLFALAPSGVLGTNVAVQLYDDATPDFQRTGAITQAQSEATAVDGNPWATLGFGPNGFWQLLSTAGDNVTNVTAIPAPGNGGTANFGLDLLVNNTGLNFGQVACLNGPVTVCGSGNILGTGGVQTPWPIFDNVDLTINVTQVPEPGALSLFGLTALVLGGLSLRTRKNS